MNKKRIILLNGPPHCGKDEIAKIVQLLLENTDHLKFAYPLIEVFRFLFDDFSDFDGSYHKFKTSVVGNKGCTGRDLIIMLSEDLMKPYVSQNIWSDRIVKEIKKSDADNIVISDIGSSQSEYDIVHSEFPTTTELWKVYREGCSFEKDSRRYVDGIPCKTINNNGTLDDLYFSVKKALNEL
jgi:hypothetical protein